MSDRRVVITGISVFNASGNDDTSFWSNVEQGKTTITKIRSFECDGLPTTVAGQLKNFNAKNYTSNRLLVKIDTFTKYALAAAKVAITDAELNADAISSPGTGVWLGNNAGGWDICERGLYEMYREGPEYVNPWQATAWFLSAPQGYVTIVNKIVGASKSFVCDRASSASALHAAYQSIKQGDNDIILAGGTEAPVTPFAMTCYYEIGEMITTKAAVDGYRPFDKASQGLLIGEGASIVVLEAYESAKARGAKIYGEIIASSSYTDADRISHEAYSHAMKKTIEKAHINAEDVDILFAEGAGFSESDKAEVVGINEVFSQNSDLVVTCPKSGFGHLYGASSVTDMIIGLLSARYKCIPPTPNLIEPYDDINFHIAQEPLNRSVDYFMVNARAREGSNFSLIVSTNGEYL